MLTPDQERLIAATAPTVAEHLDAITQRFYPLMFSRYPEVKPLFNEAHQRDGGQPRALAGAVLAYVGLREDTQQARGRWVLSSASTSPWASGPISTPSSASA